MTKTITYLYQRQHLQWEQLPAHVQESLIQRGLAQETTPSTLPETFPGRDALLEAGFETATAVPRDRATLEAIKGIGPKTAIEILQTLGVEVTADADNP